MRASVITLLLALSVPAIAEQACIKHHECINIGSFKCDLVSRSDQVHRVCYLEPQRYMVIWFKRKEEPFHSAPYHYCDIGPEVVSAFMSAESMSQYYSQNIRTKRNRRTFDCREHPIPAVGNGP